MPNPLLSVRIPPDLADLRTQERGERSRITIAALRAYLNLVDPNDVVADLQRRVETLEQRLSRRK